MTAFKFYKRNGKVIGFNMSKGQWLYCPGSPAIRDQNIAGIRYLVVESCQIIAVLVLVRLSVDTLHCYDAPGIDCSPQNTRLYYLKKIYSSLYLRGKNDEGMSNIIDLFCRHRPLKKKKSLTCEKYSVCPKLCTSLPIF